MATLQSIARLQRFLAFETDPMARTQKGKT
jgi:hypothetical protein